MHLSFGREDVFFEELWTLGNDMTCQDAFGFHLFLGNKVQFLPETIIHDKGYDVLWCVCFFGTGDWYFDNWRVKDAPHVVQGPSQIQITQDPYTIYTWNV